MQIKSAAKRKAKINKSEQTTPRRPTTNHAFIEEASPHLTSNELVEELKKIIDKVSASDSVISSALERAILEKCLGFSRALILESSVQGNSAAHQNKLSFAICLVDLLYKKSDKSFQALLLEKLYSNSNEIFSALKVNLIANNKISDSLKVNWLPILRLYIFIFSVEQITSFQNSRFENEEGFWRTLWRHFDQFFGSADETNSFSVLEITRAKIFKTLHKQFYDKKSGKMDAFEFLLHCYFIHCAKIHLENYCNFLENPDTKISQKTKSHIFNYLIKSMSAQIKIQISASQNFKSPLKSQIYKLATERQKLRNCVEGISEAIDFCQFCKMPFFSSGQSFVYYRQKQICENCLLGFPSNFPLQTENQQVDDKIVDFSIKTPCKKQKKDFEYPNVSNSPKIEYSNFHSATLGNGNLSAFLAAFNFHFAETKMVASLEIVFNSTSQAHFALVGSKIDPHRLEQDLLDAFILSISLEAENRFTRKAHNVLLLLVTQNLSQRSLGQSVEGLGLLLRNFPFLLLTPSYYRVFSVLQRQRNQQLKAFILRAQQQLVDSMPLDSLDGFAVCGESVVEKINDFAFDCLADSSDEVFENSLALIENLLDRDSVNLDVFVLAREVLKQLEENGWLFFHDFLAQKIRFFEQRQSNSVQNELIEKESGSKPKCVQITEPQIKSLLMSIVVTRQREELNSLAINLLAKFIKIGDPLARPNEFSPHKNQNQADQKTSEVRLRTSIKITKAKKSKFSPDFGSELLVKFCLLIGLQNFSEKEKISQYWLARFFEVLGSQLSGQVRLIISELKDAPELLKNKEPILLISSILNNEKTVKNSNLLSELAIVLAGIVESSLKGELFAARTNLGAFQRKEMEGEESNPNSSLQQTGQLFLLQIRCLSQILKHLNRSQFNLFYKETISNLLVFLGESMFEFSFPLFRKLVKLKILIDLNFQIFKNIEITMRKNTNFLSLTLTQISSSNEPEGSHLNRQRFSHSALVPVIKCILFIRKMLEMLPKEIFNDNFISLVFRIVVQLMQVHEKSLLQESGLLLPFFFERNLLKMNGTYELVDRVMFLEFGLRAVLYICNKLVAKGKAQGFVGLIWRRYAEKFYQAIEGSLSQRQSDQTERALTQKELVRTLATINFLAKNRELDLVRLFVLASGWIFCRQPVFGAASAGLVGQILGWDSRIASNKGTAFEVLRRMSKVICEQQQENSLEEFVEINILTFSAVKKNLLQNFLASGMDLLFDYSQSQLEKQGNFEDQFDYLLMAVLLCSPENYKASFFLKFAESFCQAIGKLQARILVFGSKAENLQEKLNKNDKGELILPKRLAKFLYYYFWICSCLYYETKTLELSNEDDHLKRQIKDKTTSEAFKILKESLAKRGVQQIENSKDFVSKLARKIDNISTCDSLKVLKVMIEKVEYKSFLFLIENDEFHREMNFAIKQSKQQKQKNQKAQNQPKRKSPAKKKVKLASKTEAKNNSLPEFEIDEASGPLPNLQPDSDCKPRYNYRKAIFHMRNRF